MTALHLDCLRALAALGENGINTNTPRYEVYRAMEQMEPLGWVRLVFRGKQHGTFIVLTESGKDALRRYADVA